MQSFEHELQRVMALCYTPLPVLGDDDFAVVPPRTWGRGVSSGRESESCKRASLASFLSDLQIVIDPRLPPPANFLNHRVIRMTRKLTPESYVLDKNATFHITPV